MLWVLLMVMYYVAVNISNLFELGKIKKTEFP